MNLILIVIVLLFVGPLFQQSFCFRIHKAVAPAFKNKKSNGIHEAVDIPYENPMVENRSNGNPITFADTHLNSLPIQANQSFIPDYVKTQRKKHKEAIRLRKGRGMKGVFGQHYANNVHSHVNLGMAERTYIGDNNIAERIAEKQKVNQPYQQKDPLSFQSNKETSDFNDFQNTEEDVKPKRRDRHIYRNAKHAKQTDMDNDSHILNRKMSKHGDKESSRKRRSSRKGRSPIIDDDDDEDIDDDDTEFVWQISEENIVPISEMIKQKFQLETNQVDETPHERSRKNIHPPDQYKEESRENDTVKKKHAKDIMKLVQKIYGVDLLLQLPIIEDSLIMNWKNAMQYSDDESENNNRIEHKRKISSDSDINENNVLSDSDMKDRETGRINQLEDVKMEMNSDNHKEINDLSEENYFPNNLDDQFKHLDETNELKHLTIKPLHNDEDIYTQGHDEYGQQYLKTTKENEELVAQNGEEIINTHSNNKIKRNNRYKEDHYDGDVMLGGHEKREKSKHPPHGYHDTDYKHQKKSHHFSHSTHSETPLDPVVNSETPSIQVLRDNIESLEDLMETNPLLRHDLRTQYYDTKDLLSKELKKISLIEHDEQLETNNNEESSYDQTSELPQDSDKSYNKRKRRSVDYEIEVVQNGSRKIDFIDPSIGYHVAEDKMKKLSNDVNDHREQEKTRKMFEIVHRKKHTRIKKTHTMEKMETASTDFTEIHNAMKEKVATALPTYLTDVPNQLSEKIATASPTDFTEIPNAIKEKMTTVLPTDFTDVPNELSEKIATASPSDFTEIPNAMKKKMTTVLPTDFTDVPNELSEKIATASPTYFTEISSAMKEKMTTVLSTDFTDVPNELSEKIATASPTHFTEIPNAMKEKMTTVLPTDLTAVPIKMVEKLTNALPTGSTADPDVMIEKMTTASPTDHTTVLPTDPTMSVDKEKMADFLWKETTQIKVELQDGKIAPDDVDELVTKISSKIQTKKDDGQYINFL